MENSQVQEQLDSQQKAWAVYLEHEDVMLAGLRSTGPWSVEDGLDLIGDFVTYRLAKALSTYDARVGDIKPWLYRVFTNYAKNRKREIGNAHRQFAEFEQHVSSYLVEEDVGDEIVKKPDLGSLELSFRSLPVEVQDYVVFFFQEDPSIRAMGKQFGLSRYSAKKELFCALSHIAANLAPGFFSEDELETVLAFFRRNGDTQLIHDSAHENLTSKLGVFIKSILDYVEGRAEQ